MFLDVVRAMSVVYFQFTTLSVGFRIKLCFGPVLTMGAVKVVLLDRVDSFADRNWEVDETAVLAFLSWQMSDTEVFPRIQF